MIHQAAVTLIICSRDGSRTLRKCLDHVQSMEGVRTTEIVLVDNGSTDNTYSIMQDFCDANPDMWLVIQESKPGNSAGRNAGIQFSSGEVVLFIDDDCYPDRMFACAWKEVFDRDAELGFAAGRILPFDERLPRLGCNTNTISETLPPRNFLRRGIIQGSNMAFRRSCLMRAGLFDERFGAGTPFAGEEWDVALRASFAGWRGGYFPEPSVAHDHGRSEADASIRERYYDVGAGAVYAKHLLTLHAPVTGLTFAGEIRRHLGSGIVVISLMQGAARYYQGVIRQVGL